MFIVGSVVMSTVDCKAVPFFSPNQRTTRGRASHTSHVPRVVRWLGEKKGTALQSMSTAEARVHEKLCSPSLSRLLDLIRQSLSITLYSRSDIINLWLPFRLCFSPSIHFLACVFVSQLLFMYLFINPGDESRKARAKYFLRFKFFLTFII